MRSSLPPGPAPARPCPAQHLLSYTVKLADVPDGHRPQPRPDRRRGHRPDPQDPLRSAGTQRIGDAEAVPTSQ